MLVWKTSDTPTPCDQSQGASPLEKQSGALLRARICANKLQGFDLAGRYGYADYAKLRNDCCVDSMADTVLTADQKFTEIQSQLDKIPAELSSLETAVGLQGTAQANQATQVAQAAASSGIGGVSQNTLLLIIGLVVVFFLFKK